MSDEMTAWFHCGHCGSLFRSVADDVDDRRCTSCGKEPWLGMEAEPAAAANALGGRDPMLRVKMAEVEKPAFYKREVRRQKANFFVFKLIIGWAVAMALVAVGIKMFSRETRAEEKSQIAEKAVSGTLADADVELLHKSYPKILPAFSGYLSAGTPEAKNQFVRNPVDTAGKMARYYQLNPLGYIDPKTVKGTKVGVIHLPGRKAIETRWESTDGRKIDAVFFEEAGEWKLDWEEYVRYSEHPWNLFLAGDGPAEAEFRLFARERLAEQRSEVSKLNIVLHAPRFGYPSDAEGASPEFLIDQDSPQGKALKAAFAARKSGDAIYSALKMENRDPEDMIRVRVKVRRYDGTLGRELIIEEVKACHWLAIPESGVETP